MDKAKVMSVIDLANHLVNGIDLENVLDKRFPKCDFFIIEAESGAEYSEEEMDYLESTACGWYGIKSVDTGFDSDCLVLVTDYYGGCCMAFTQLYDGISKEDAVSSIAEIIVESMNVQEAGVTKNTVLYCEFR